MIFWEDFSYRVKQTWPEEIKYHIQLLTTPKHKTDRYEVNKVYDGMTRNDFKRGHIITLLIQLSVLKCSSCLLDPDDPKWNRGCNHDWWYWHG